MSFIVSFFVVEAQTQISTALGFAVLEIPDDVRLDEGVAELSADLTSPDGKPLEDVVCVVDLKVTSCVQRARIALRAWQFLVGATGSIGHRQAYTFIHVLKYTINTVSTRPLISLCGASFLFEQATGPPPLSARESSSSEEEDEVGQVLFCC